MQWNNGERESFKNAIRELIRQVDECIARDNKTQKGKISSTDTTIKGIKDFLSFLETYGYRFNVGIGNMGGFLNSKSYIIFAPSKILRQDCVNSEKLSAQRGVYIYLYYGGYFENNPHLGLSFGFPKGDIENSRCKAVNEMEKHLDKYVFKYTKQEFEFDKIIDDFITMCEYFSSFESSDFRVENNAAQNPNMAKDIAESKNIPLNQILYGPPGTGKTYHTIDKALEILFAWKEIGSIPQERDEKKKIFNDFISDEQIAFVTFHQSYGYEDFVEGIRPRLSGENDESQISEKMEYEIKDGIFKSMCKKANENYEKSQKDSSEVKREIELDDLLEQYATYIEDELKEGKEPKFESKEWTTKMKIQGVHRLQNGDFSSIVIGVSNDSNSMQRLSQKVIKRDYEKFKSGEIKDWNDIRPSYESKSHRHGNAGYYFTLYESIAEFEKTHYQTSTIPALESTLDNRLKPYILIIDEINRGNISKILGELITLLEPSKRKGESEALEVTLPYSQEPFSVPNNLYIIGTMNTADRSIALLDTALRRRFEFIEMMPDSSVLENESCDGVDLCRLLDSINKRISFLLDREHQIGHSYLLNVGSLENLRAAFSKKILPLLQEYFYDDYAKINAVLNNNEMIKSQTQQDLGIKLDDEFVDSQKKVWSITDSSSWTQWQFQKIYDTNAKPAESKESPESSNEPSE